MSETELIAAARIAGHFVAVRWDGREHFVTVDGAEVGRTPNYSRAMSEMAAHERRLSPRRRTP